MGDTAATKAFFGKAFTNNICTKKVTLDKIGSNMSTVNSVNKNLPEDKKIDIYQTK